MKEAVEQIIAILRQPVSDDERRAGWRKNVKNGYVPIFLTLLAQIEQGEERPYFAIARSLDAYGIGSGCLYEMMLRAANESDAQLR